jgi:thioredoxin-like negative regulator of GroEL
MPDPGVNNQTRREMTTRRGPGALGDEVMTSMTNQQVEQLLADVNGESAAIADLAGCLDRIKVAQAAKEVLATLPAAQVRAALEARRTAGLELDRRPR